MRKQSLDFLRQLLATPSPSGFEERIQEVCRGYASPFSDDIYKDVHGNQYHVLNPKGKLRVMLAGHVDEIGLMVNTIDERGFIGLVPIGGVDAQTLPGCRVHVHGSEGPILGVIGRKAIHLTPIEDRKKYTDFHEMWVDIGATSREEVERQVRIGDAITVDAGFAELMNNRIVSRAVDDRIGAFVILEALRLLHKKKVSVAVYAVTTVQEEIGLRGATTAAHKIEPHLGIAVDVAWATDHPNGEGNRYGHTKIDGGPILDRGPNINRVVHAGLVATAGKHNISYQMRAMPRGTGTDANAMQLVRGGCATAIVGIPNRYMHTPVEVVSLGDVEAASTLLAEYIGGLKANASFIP